MYEDFGSQSGEEEEDEFLKEDKGRSGSFIFCFIIFLFCCQAHIFFVAFLL